MKKYITLFCLLSLVSFSSRAQFFLEGGIELVANNELTIVLENMDWENEGSFTPASSEIILRGSSSTNLGGSYPLPLYRLTLDKSGSGNVQMTGAIEVTDNLKLLGGNLDMDGFAIDLKGGRILFERNGREVFSSSPGGRIRRSINYNNVTAADSGNLGIFITSPTNLGIVNVTRSHDPQFVGGANAIKRYYQVSTTNNPGSNATIRFHYNDNELNGLLESDLEMFRSTDNGANWTPEGYSSRDNNQNFVEIANVNPDGRWTLTSAGSFPVEWLDFDAVPKGGEVHCQWATASEINTDYFEVQRSVDGSTFEGLGRTKAMGNSQQVQQYEAVDANPLMGRSFYRIKQVDLDGSYSFSPQVNVFFSPDTGIRLYPNPASEKAWIDLSLATAGPVKLNLYDMNGRTVVQETHEMERGSHRLGMNLKHLARGIYSVKVQTAQESFQLKLQIR